MKMTLTLLVALMMPVIAVAQDAKKGYTVGSVVADFTLKNTDGKQVSLKSLAEGKKYIVIDFWSRECPAAKSSEGKFAQLNTDYAAKGVQLVHIAANKAENKADADIEKTKAYVKKQNNGIPVLLDPDNKTADTFNALVTPHVFVIDTKDMKVVYVGALTNDPWKNEKVTKEYVREALEALLGGKPVATPTTKPEGCTIKRAAG